MVGVMLLLGLGAINLPLMRVMLSLLLILFLPGYGITAILFPRGVLDFPARLLLSVGLSLTFAALSGLLLNLTTAGIQTQNPWFVLLLGGMGLVGLIFFVRDVFQIEITGSVRRLGISSRQTLLLVSAVAIATLAFAVARTPASPKNLTGYTMFWVQAGDLPNVIKLGVRSEEFKATSYQLRYEMNDVLQQGPTFELEPGKTWEYSLKLESSKVTGKPVTLLLYRLDHPDTVYRRVVWWNEKY